MALHPHKDAPTFSGSIVALVTPFKSEKVDTEKLAELIHFHVQTGTSGICVLGCTGENFTIREEERKTVVLTAVKEAKGKLPIIVGTGASSFWQALERTKLAKDWGAQGALVMTPYGNKPNQEGLFTFYSELAAKAKLPILLYNVPSRTGVNLLPETVARLSERKYIVGLKEASGDYDQYVELRQKTDLPLLCGDDHLLLPALMIGAVGTVSTVANIVPEDVLEIIANVEGKHWDRARERYEKIYPLARSLMLESNPIPLKTAMKLLGRLNGELRPPLAPMAQNNLNALRRALRDYGLM